MNAAAGEDRIHRLDPAGALRLMGSGITGLSASRAIDLLREHGPNTLEMPEKNKLLKSLLRQFTNFFTILLYAAAAICFVAEKVQPGESMDVLGYALTGVALLNAIFSFIQEYKAERAMQALKKFMPSLVTVVRDGAEISLPVEDIVPGDLLLVREGDRIAADARLLETTDLLVNNAPLTGESKPVSCGAEPARGRLSESRNCVFAGCTVLRGSGRAVVFATGLTSSFGKIARLSQVTERPPSPLEKETRNMVRVLTIIAVCMGIGFFLYGVFSGRPLWVNLVFMMGIIVANVPEGLLPTFTLALAMGSLRMAKKNVLVKNLNAVEALGSVHVICTDKTGTLTENRLSIGESAVFSGEKFALHRESQQTLTAHALAASEPSGGVHAVDPLDLCLEEEQRSRFPQMKIIHRKIYAFDFHRKSAAGIADWEGQTLFCIKGAWEALRDGIGFLATEEGILPWDRKLADAAEETVNRMASRGYRVIAVASRRIDAGETEAPRESLERDLVLTGFLGIEDPLRPGVGEAVARCHEAGIRVVLITGDHPRTAAAIAGACGIIRDGGENAILTGTDLEGLSESELQQRLQSGCCVFARTTPEQKLKIVSAFKNMHMIVAMTGDGVNDAPALKAADVGIAMGKNGTDVARESSQIILLDDNFASIVSGVAEGRAVFANIRKFTNYVLVSNGPEILPYILYIIFPVPLALNIIQILCIDLGTDIVPSMALGKEPPDPADMKKPPRGLSHSLLNWPLIRHSYLFLGLLEAAWALTLFFWFLVEGGWQFGELPPSSSPLYRSATGLTLGTIILMQIGNFIGRRSEFGSGFDRNLLRNSLTIAGFAFELIFAWALLYWEPLSSVLGTGPVPVKFFLLALAGIPIIYGFDWLRKQLFRPRSI